MERGLRLPHGQTIPHARALSPLAVALRAELEGRPGERYGVFEDLQQAGMSERPLDPEALDSAAINQLVDEQCRVSERPSARPLQTG